MDSAVAATPRRAASTGDYYLRCHHCDGLLAQVTRSGALEIRARGRLVAVVRDGVIGCPRCEALVLVTKRVDEAGVVLVDYEIAAGGRHHGRADVAATVIAAG